LGVYGKARQPNVPLRGQLALIHASKAIRQFRMLFLVDGPLPRPSFAQWTAARGDGAVNVVLDAVRYQELGVLRPPVVALGEANLILAQGLAMGFARIVLVRRAEPDMAVNDNKRRRLTVILECG